MLEDKKSRQANLRSAFHSQLTANAPTAIGTARPRAKASRRTTPSNTDPIPAVTPSSTTRAGVHTGHTATAKPDQPDGFPSSHPTPRQDCKDAVRRPSACASCMPAASSLPTMATTPARCSTTSDTRTSSTRVRYTESGCNSRLDCNAAGIINSIQEDWQIIVSYVFIYRLLRAFPVSIVVNYQDSSLC